MKNKVSLQINLAPGDYLHAKAILKHQLNVLSNQVDEILLTVDTRPSKGRFSTDWQTYKDDLNSYLENDIGAKHNARLIFVDYEKTAKQEVAHFFFGTDYIPDKDFRGGPFYAYFYGLFHAQNNLIFHLDSDMLLGGCSQTWVAEAVELLSADPDCFTVSPLPGPPHPKNILIGQDSAIKTGNHIYRFQSMSTRIFMLDKSRFELQKLSPKKPSLKQQIKAIVEGNSNADLPENIIIDYINRNGLYRIDFLGKAPGCWSLHPPYRTKTFYDGLEALIKNVEAGILPAEQDGFYDVVDAVCNWQEARDKLNNNRWWKRLLT